DWINRAFLTRTSCSLKNKHKHCEQMFPKSSSSSRENEPTSGKLTIMNTKFQPCKALGVFSPPPPLLHWPIIHLHLIFYPF
ncbi:hypothetical protein, partial [Bradyrhizobium cosmicum]|uniref:hypothetical protein n=1 Tax=Bradyrhizobium cosmicum TaxID=1404864 RepID=UPI0028E49DB7